MDPTTVRMRYILAFLAAAVIAAAALRHLLHVQAGFTREEICTWDLIIFAISLVLAVAFFRWRRRR